MAVMERLRELDRWAADPGPRAERVAAVVVIVFSAGLFLLLSSRISPWLFVAPALCAFIPLVRSYRRGCDRR